MTLRWVIPLTSALLAVAACEPGSDYGYGSGNNYGSGNSYSYSSGNSSSNSSGGGVSSSVSCANAVCRIAISGDPSGTRLGVFGRSLRVVRIDDDEVTINLSGDEVRIPEGATETIDGLRVRVAEAEDRSAELEIRRG